MTDEEEQLACYLNKDQKEKLFSLKYQCEREMLMRFQENFMIELMEVLAQISLDNDDPGWRTEED